jgi:hypothetical protein
LQDVSDKYNSLLDLVSRGPTPYGERLAGVAAMDSFFLRRGKEEVKAMFPVSEQVRPGSGCCLQFFADWLHEQGGIARCYKLFGHKQPLRTSRKQPARRCGLRGVVGACVLTSKETADRDSTLDNTLRLSARLLLFIPGDRPV